MCALVAAARGPRASQGCVACSPGTAGASRPLGIVRFVRRRWNPRGIRRGCRRGCRRSFDVFDMCVIWSESLGAHAFDPEVLILSGRADVAGRQRSVYDVSKGMC